jgi:hypothetical protein
MMHGQQNIKKPYVFCPPTYLPLFDCPNRITAYIMNRTRYLLFLTRFKSSQVLFSLTVTLCSIFLIVTEQVSLQHRESDKVTVLFSMFKFLDISAYVSFTCVEAVL